MGTDWNTGSSIWAWEWTSLCMTEHWNKLLREVMESPSLGIFKNFPVQVLGNISWGVGLDDLQRSPTPQLLWFYDHSETKLKEPANFNAGLTWHEKDNTAAKISHFLFQMSISEFLNIPCTPDQWTNATVYFSIFFFLICSYLSSVWNWFGHNEHCEVSFIWLLECLLLEGKNWYKLFTILNEGFCYNR